ncbi:MAG: saccharopine dehydrogenase NADP-binding domain-containing protein [Bacteroidales bacterium]|nr:saccharopine dehydrogenase NADP-binding domain-containing protein [Bacteroidales bacterium]
MKKVSVLGAGMVGKAIAIDLQKSFKVTSYDINEDNLKFLSEKHGIKIKKADLSVAEEIHSAVKDSNFVVCAVPGFMGFETLKQIIKAGKNVVDISFFPEDAFELDEFAKANNVTAVVDCGVAPGMGNIICGYHNERMQMTDYKCFVGGLPFKREWPFDYKAVFSPIDVIEEYTRPARYIQNNELVVREALSEPELINFEQAGTLEAFNSDGLRSLMKTMKIPNMIEKTLRYPGTVEYMKVLRACGFFDKTEVDVKGNQIRPLDLTAKLLFPKWELKKGEKEFTVMQICCEGKENDKEIKYIYDLFDVYNDETETTSMARTTGYTCTAVVNLLSEGLYTQKGISPPEFVGMSEKNFTFILKYLSKRGIDYKMKKVIIN